MSITLLMQLLYYLGQISWASANSQALSLMSSHRPCLDVSFVIPWKWFTICCSGRSAKGTSRSCTHHTRAGGTRGAGLHYDV